MLWVHNIRADWEDPSHPSGKCGICEVAVFCRKVPVLLEKKLDFSDQKIKAMVHGYLPWRLLSIPLSAYREKAPLTTSFPEKPPLFFFSFLSPPLKGLLGIFTPQRMWKLYFLSWNTTEHVFIGRKFQYLASPNQNFWKLGARSLACTNWLVPLCSVHRGFGPS